MRDGDETEDEETAKAMREEEDEEDSVNENDDDDDDYEEDVVPMRWRKRRWLSGVAKKLLMLRKWLDIL